MYGTNNYKLYKYLIFIIYYYYIMDEFPSSWNLVKRSLPTLASYAIGSITSAYRAGQRQAKAVSLDSDTPVTWQGQRLPLPSRMPKVSYRPRRYYRRRYRRSRVSKSVSNPYRTLVRSTNIASWTINNTNDFKAIVDFKLSDVRTDDIINVYRQYRIRKIVLHVTPRVDPANSGLSNNFQYLMTAALDPDAGVTLGSITNRVLTSYDNSYSKFVNSGEQFNYTCYPKATNAIEGTGGVTALLGAYSRNPWIQMSSTGILVPHKQLLFFATTGAATTVSFDWYFDIHFEVRVN